MFDQDAPVLRTDEVADEGFYLVGLIGGKEVGKSALVNAGEQLATAKPQAASDGAAIASV